MRSKSYKTITGKFKTSPDLSARGKEYTEKVLKHLERRYNSIRMIEAVLLLAGAITLISLILIFALIRDEILASSEPVLMMFVVVGMFGIMVLAFMFGHVVGSTSALEMIAGSFNIFFRERVPRRDKGDSL